MFRWGRAKRRAWRRRSRYEQVEAATRWTLLATPWIFGVSGLPQIFVALADETSARWLALLVVLLGFTQCALSMGGFRQGVNNYLNVGPAPVRRLLVMAAAFALSVGALLVLVARGQVGPGPSVALTLFGALPALTGTYGLCVPVRRASATVTVGATVLTGAFALAGMSLGSLLATWFVTVATGLLGIYTPRSSTWYLAVMRELDQARTVQSRLAVAEERLRFSRDLHDVMGRNLSVIALKSELAVQLARRDTETAVEQMEEVQRLARESQTEVRAVVRGYREAGLHTELAGARGVLRAAGVDCRIEDGAPELPAEAQSVLGWVVREGATNILRHAEATRCTVRVSSTGLGREGASAVLVMENDGVCDSPARPTKGGSGLAGLRERLAALGGTLTAEPAADSDGAVSLFRLHAEVPLRAGPGPEPEPDAGEGGGAGTGTDSGAAADGGADAAPRTAAVTGRTANTGTAADSGARD
ncbi:sensor histidine kinase [Streptomyces axinellae]|uniref:Histidine kinase n=1 Tax=Streptomyces axinellae TaxID=552788 RepID=A0ABN3PVR2_9ACTN